MNKNIKNKYRKATIKLDNHEFVECFFEECKLEYAGKGPVSIVDCTFINVQWVFVDAAQETLQFLQGLYHGMGEGGRTLVETTFNNIRAFTPIAKSSSVH
jgi:hypothetical protein